MIILLDKVFRLLEKVVESKFRLYRLLDGLTAKRLDLADKRINLCCGPIRVPGYVGLDISPAADVRLNLLYQNLPFDDGTQESVICISAINYFSRERAQEIVTDVHRILKPGGVARFGVQDLESIAKRYVEKDMPFFFQKNSEGNERFEGLTLGDKFVAWFYGYESAGSLCRYFYDYQSLAPLFENAGFSVIERKKFCESCLDDIKLIDNRADQMFFLEAVK